LYVSIGFRVARPLAEFQGFALIAAAIVMRELRRQGVAGLSLKWPNDIFLHGRKLAGLLIETQRDASSANRAAQTQTQTQIVIGLGLNLVQAPKVDQPTIALAAAGYSSLVADPLLASIGSAWHSALASSGDPLAHALDEVQARHHLRGRRVRFGIRRQAAVVGDVLPDGGLELLVARGKGNETDSVSWHSAEFEVLP
jgi:BirA family transcriptional regulator, biotin operon repressor / biotin---[acetyl-CoA-carboxylase] ligase